MKNIRIDSLKLVFICVTFLNFVFSSVGHAWTPSDHGMNAPSYKQACYKTNVDDLQRFTYSDGQSASTSWEPGEWPINCTCSIRLVPEGELALDVKKMTSPGMFENFKWDKDIVYSIYSQQKYPFGGCPSEIDYASLMEYFRQLREARKNKLRQEQFQNEQKEAARVASVNKYCTGTPKVYQNLLERVSSYFQVDLNSVRLLRVQKDIFGGCAGVFNTARGVKNCSVSFDSNGVVAQVLCI